MASGSIIVPDHEIEFYLANAWRLSDEPSCGGARVVPPVVSVNRVPAMKKAGRAMPEPAKVQISDVGYNRAARAAQQRRR
jgi:hypothetical protein